MFERLTLSIACSLVLLLATPGGASAQELKETFWLVSNSWKIIETSNNSAPAPSGTKNKISYPTFTVEVQEGGKQRKFPINMFMLAQTMHADNMSVVSYQLAMAEYLKGLKKLSKADALIKLGSVKQNGPVEVVGIWQFNSQQAYKRATVQGSEIMNLTAAQVKKIGSEAAYKAELIKRTQSNWAQIDSRKAK